MKNFNCVKLWIFNDSGICGDDNEKINAVSNILKKYDVKTLEQLALELYENYYFIDFPKEYLVDILDLALYERSSKPQAEPGCLSVYSLSFRQSSQYISSSSY